MSADAPELSIVLPAFDEELRIERSLRRLIEFADGRAGGIELLVVDDGSRDATAERVAAIGGERVRLLRLAENRGKGAALRAGVAATRGARVLLTDVDLSTPITELARLEAALADADIAIGSRALPDSRITRRQPRWRELAGKTFNLAVRALGVPGFRDTQCGFKLLRGDAARPLFAEMEIDRFAFDVELVWLAVRRGLRVVEVAVEWRDESGSRVRLLRDGGRMLADVVRLRRRFARIDRAERRRGAAP